MINFLKSLTKKQRIALFFGALIVFFILLFFGVDTHSLPFNN